MYEKDEIFFFLFQQLDVLNINTYIFMNPHVWTGVVYCDNWQ